MTVSLPLKNQSYVRRKWRFLLATAWLIFTLSLLCWWMYFGFEQVERLSDLGYPNALELARFQRMLVWEGGTLIALIFAGGCAGFFTLARELKTQSEVRAFFAAFTHELRTSLSSLLIKTEVLDANQADNKPARELTAEVERIRLQLDNALLATVSGEGGVRCEALSVADVVRRLAERFPELSVSMQGETNILVCCDARALEGMISNLFHNAIMHGKAGGITLKIEALSSNKVSLTFRDDGVGFLGDKRLLGQRFVRHYSGSGAGVGLFLVKDLATRCRGSFTCEVLENNAFIARLVLERAA